MIPSSKQKAVMLYESPGGIFRKRKVEITSEGLIERKLRWFHRDREDCVFPIEEPIKLQEFSELLNAPDKAHPSIPSGWMVIGEENGYFPYGTRIVLDWMDIEHRQNYRLEDGEVGRQNAELRNIKHALGNPLLTTFALIGAMIITLMAAVAGIALIMTVLDNRESTAMLLVMMGAVVPLPLKRKVKAERKPFDPSWIVYLYCTVTGKKKRYALPFSQIFAHPEVFPTDCWRYPNRTFWRRGGALAVFAVLLFWYGIIGFSLPEYLLIIVPLALITLPMAAVAGFLAARQLMYKVSWFHRPYVKVYRHQDQDGNYFLSPIRYTGLTGIDPLLYADLIGRNMADVERLAKESNIGQMPQFDPIVNRADDAYEDIEGKLEGEMVRIPMSGSQKIQLASVVMMAFASVGIAFFVVMATMG